MQCVGMGKVALLFPSASVATLQCIAVNYSVLQRVQLYHTDTVCCSGRGSVAIVFYIGCSVLTCVAVCFGETQ